MGGKKSGQALKREGLERTDNGMKQSNWPEISMINQKNYYTEYMKRDDQILPLRIQNEENRDKMVRGAKERDRALAQNAELATPMIEGGEFGEEGEEPASFDDLDPSKVIVIHPGSQNLRIGLASDALPRTIPMVLASKWPVTESEEAEPLPKRQKLADGSAMIPEQLFGEEFSKKYVKQSSDLKIDMRQNKRKVLPNSKELVVNFNRRTPPELIPEHNDPSRIEWTDIKTDNGSPASTFTGAEAQRIPDDSDPKYKLFWPIQHGWFHEDDYLTVEHLKEDIDSIFEHAIKKELGLTKMRDWKQYRCVFVIPDLYDKNYVNFILDLFMREYEFSKICFIQESLAASFGAGYSSACIVDIGAQKTSICCVEDGMCVEDSRINLKYGGYDVTETFIKMMLYDHFPYADINLRRRYDFILAEELKQKYCTMNQAEISVQLFNFHLRAPNQPTHKYNFKTYDEVILAPMGFFDPTIFDNSTKLNGRRKLIDRSYNYYDPDVPDDPSSNAQFEIINSIKPISTTTNGVSEAMTPMKNRTYDALARLENGTMENTPAGSTTGSPAPEGLNTPNPVNGAINGGSPAPNGPNINGTVNGTGTPALNAALEPVTRSARDVAAERDAVLPIAPLDTAIMTSITHAARGDDKKFRDLLGSIMLIGGGAKTPGLGTHLEEKLKRRRPDLADRILVGTSPREMDGQVVTWKGASVFAKLSVTNDSWIGPLEHERLGSRVLHHKVMWNW